MGLYKSNKPSATASWLHNRLGYPIIGSPSEDAETVTLQDDRGHEMVINRGEGKYSTVVINRFASETERQRVTGDLRTESGSERIFILPGETRLHVLLS